MSSISKPMATMCDSSESALIADTDLLSDPIVAAYVSERLGFNGGRFEAVRPRCSIREPFLPYVLLDEFLLPQEINSLRSFTQERQTSFEKSTVIVENMSMLDEQRRKSAILFDLEGFETLFRARVLHTLPFVCERLEVPPFLPSHVEVQLTVTPNGGFFSEHDDNSNEAVRTRRITFVYYFTLGPMLYTGGVLRFLERSAEGRTTVRDEVAPQHNMMVCFKSDTLHEVTEVRCSPGDFASGRFTVNGWIHA
jgi:Rps23 Pro-64 3,4-dihydroxylase Tpa1-like proline 4-hydroxylase